MYVTLLHSFLFYNIAFMLLIYLPFERQRDRDGGNQRKRSHLLVLSPNAIIARVWLGQSLAGALNSVQVSHTGGGSTHLIYNLLLPRVCTSRKLD